MFCTFQLRWYCWHSIHWWLVSYFLASRNIRRWHRPNYLLPLPLPSSFSFFIRLWPATSPLPHRPCKIVVPGHSPTGYIITSQEVFVIILIIESNAVRVVASTIEYIDHFRSSCISPFYPNSISSFKSITFTPYYCHFYLSLSLSLSLWCSFIAFDKPDQASWLQFKCNWTRPVCLFIVVHILFCWIAQVPPGQPIDCSEGTFRHFNCNWIDIISTPNNVTLRPIKVSLHVDSGVDLFAGEIYVSDKVCWNKLFQYLFSNNWTICPHAECQSRRLTLCLRCVSLLTESCSITSVWLGTVPQTTMNEHLFLSNLV